MGLTPDYVTLQTRVAKQFHTNFVVELSSLTWEERILPILSELEVRGSVVKVLEKTPKALTFFICKDLKDLSSLRRLKDYPDETDAKELLDSWTGICVEEKSVVVVNPKLVTGIISDRH